MVSGKDLGTISWETQKKYGRLATILATILVVLTSGGTSHGVSKKMNEEDSFFVFSSCKSAIVRPVPLDPNIILTTSPLDPNVILTTSPIGILTVIIIMTSPGNQIALSQR